MIFCVWCRQFEEKQIKERFETLLEGLLFLESISTTISPKNKQNAELLLHIGNLFSGSGLGSVNRWFHLPGFLRLPLSSHYVVECDFDS